MQVTAVIPSAYGHQQDSVGSVFFQKNELYPSSKMTLHFTRIGSTVLPRIRADSIPFSSAKVLEVLSRLSIPADSPAAADIHHTLAECEAPPTEGITAQTCATSLESMVDFAASNLGTRNIHALATKLSNEDGVTPKQAYTVESVRTLPMSGHNNVACHIMPYPYAIYTCHTTTAALYMVTLAGADGTKADALAACHLDASPIFSNEKNSVAPGSVPVCHFLSQESRVWVRN